MRADIEDRAGGKSVKRDYNEGLIVELACTNVKDQAAELPLSPGAGRASRPRQHGGRCSGTSLSAPRQPILRTATKWETEAWGQSGAATATRGESSEEMQQ